MGRIVTFIGALSLLLAVAGCKGQAERDAAQTATGVQGARAAQTGSGDQAIGDEPLGEWERAQTGEAKVGGGPGDTTLVTVQIRAPYGEYLADSSGMSLYIFEADTPGEPSTCYDACAEAWPPAIVEGDTGTGAEMNLPAQLDPTLLSTSVRRDGQMQLAYNGLPLYTYARDENPGDIEGQDVDGFGGEWYLMAPSGQKIEDDDDDRDDDATILEDVDDVNEMD